jgi:hypothetical protein
MKSDTPSVSDGGQKEKVKSSTNGTRTDSALLDLMRRMGASNFEPLPPDQIKTFLLSFHTAQERVLAWVRVHTVCFPCWSPYCVDSRRNELRQVDCARELGLNESVVSRRIARLSFLGLVRVDENGRIYLCGVVIPPPELATLYPYCCTGPQKQGLNR